MINDNIIDFTNNSSGGGGTSFTTAMLSYPTGTSASSDSTLYNYIKGMYDVAPSMIDLGKDYSLVGAPTIDNDGIASGFSSSNYITVPALGTTLSTASNWEIEIEGTTPVETYPPDVEGELIGFNEASDDYDGIVFAHYSDNGTLKLYLEAHYTGSTYVECELGLNTKFKAKIEFTGTAYKYYVSINDSAYTLLQTVNTTAKVTENLQKCIIGNIDISSYSRPWLGSINLNSFRMKINGEYKFFGSAIPCRTLSTGSKVVDVENKTLVDKYVADYGSALYYIIDTTNQTVTLPQGDIFGFISTLFFN